MSASFTLPTGLSVSSQSWTVPGTTIGGYTATLSSGSTTPTGFTQQSTTFYWVDAAASRSVSYTVNFNNGTQSTAQMAFNVEGISGLMVQSSPGTVQISSGKLRFGDNMNNPGANFSASYSSVPADFQGLFSWTQLINSSNWTYAPVQTGSTCSAGPGLDMYVSYTTGQNLDDSPGVPLISGFSDLTAAGSFSSYLMWQPYGTGMSTSIAVPLGHMNWSWSGEAQLNNGIWSVVSNPVQPTPSWSATLDFPQWSVPVNQMTGSGISCQ